MKPSREYGIWQGIIQRCENASCRAFKYYGGLGVKVCERWRTSFENFVADMGPRPSPKHSVDRFPNPCGDYEPGNCRWATAQEQARNTRRNLYVSYLGERVLLIELVERLGIRYKPVYEQLRRGVPLGRALLVGPKRVATNKPCIRKGCRNLTTTRYCPACAPPSHRPFAYARETKTTKR